MVSSTQQDQILLLTLPSVAKKLSLGRSTIYEMVGRGELPSIRLGRTIRVPAAALDDWLQKKFEAAQ